MSDNPNKAHIHIEVDRDLHTRALPCIPWGLRSEMFRKVLEMIVEAIEKHGSVMVGLIANGQMRLVMRDDKEE